MLVQKPQFDTSAIGVGDALQITSKHAHRGSYSWKALVLTVTPLVLTVLRVDGSEYCAGEPRQIQVSEVVSGDTKIEPLYTKYRALRDSSAEDLIRCLNGLGSFIVYGPGNYRVEHGHVVVEAVVKESEDRSEYSTAKGHTIIIYQQPEEGTIGD